jgi:transposase InsO family protein
MRFVFIQSHARIYHIVTMCRVLEVSRAGYYAWRARPLCERVKDDRVLSARIRQIHHEVKGRYGSPRVRMELRALGIRCSRKRVVRLMHAEGLRAKSGRRYRVLTRSDHARPVWENVLGRQFAPAQHPRPDAVWVGDITFIPTREGWCYLAVLLDLATRQVVGWALGPSADQALVLEALRMALTHRDAHGGLHHSDRGIQYASFGYQRALAAAGFTPSMSRTGNCWDNAVAESFFATLTKELLIDGVFQTRREAKQALFEFIEIWYNRKRRHSSLEYRTPVEYEAQLLQAC